MTYTVLSEADEKLFVKWLIDVYNLGDRDECSLKHIGHAMAALLAFDDWKQADDYKQPTDDEMTRAEEVKLGALWDVIRKIVVRVGDQTILNTLPILAKKYWQLSYINYCVEREWSGYKAQIEANGYEIREV